MSDGLWDTFFGKPEPPPPLCSTLPELLLEWGPGIFLAGIILIIIISFSNRENKKEREKNTVQLQTQPKNLSDSYYDDDTSDINETKLHFKCTFASMKSRETFTFIVIKNAGQCSSDCLSILDECKNLSAIGFDCEWNSLFGRQEVALIQLASYSGKCFLFRLNVLGHIPPPLAEILKNENIIKVGVSPALDGKYLLQDYGVQVRSTLDLRHLYPSTKGGIYGVAKEVLGLIWDQSPRISNWENSELTDDQKEYAALDALAGIKVFKKWLVTQKESNSKLSEVTGFLNKFLDMDYEPGKEILQK